MTKLCQKRLLNEIPRLNDYYPLDFYLETEFDKYNNLVYLVKENTNKIEIILCKHYPFKPPAKLKINNTDYLNLLCYSNKYLEKVLETKKIKCLCCSTMLCANNWSPSKTLLKLLHEYFNNKDMVIKSIYTKYIDIIISQNNMPLKIKENILKYI
jgi:hypothetical protein